MNAIGQDIPGLRRYARALCGDRRIGDACVARALEALLADPTLLKKNGGRRIGLYRTFQTFWSNASPAGDGRPVEAAPAGLATCASLEAQAHRRLSRLTPLCRQALLLTALEGFSAGEAGEILAVGCAEVSDLVNAARQAIADDLACDVLIIEDETLIGLDLKDIVRSMGHTVTGVARTRQEALDRARSAPPGLVLADIKLADGSSGVDAVQDILALFDVPVIFVTAYQEKLPTGARPQPAFLIPKPFDPDIVRRTIGQALFFEINAGGTNAGGTKAGEMKAGAGRS